MTKYAQRASVKGMIAVKSGSDNAKRRYVVTVRLTPRGGNRRYVVAAADSDEAMALAAAKLSSRLPYGIGWDVVSIEDIPLM